MTFVIFNLSISVLELRKYSVSNVLILQVGKPEFGPQKRYRQNQGMVVYTLEILALERQKQLAFGRSF